MFETQLVSSILSHISMCDLAMRFRTQYKKDLVNSLVFSKNLRLLLLSKI
jgi:hypothetical protein